MKLLQICKQHLELGKAIIYNEAYTSTLVYVKDEIEKAIGENDEAINYFTKQDCKDFPDSIGAMVKEKEAENVVFYQWYDMFG